MIKKIIKKAKLIPYEVWNRAFFLFLSGLIIFLSMRVPINPDEYLYVAISNNFAEAFRGNACFSCVDTYHTFLLPLILATFNFVTNIDVFIIYRIIIAVFSIGSIFFLSKIFKITFKNSEFNPIVLLLLFPAFFYYGGLVLLDNVAFFFFTIFIYLLLKRVSYWKVGVLMALIFFSKEYYIIFCGFIVLVLILYDAFIENRNLKMVSKLTFICKNSIASFLLVILLMSSIILFPILPYPSLLGTFLLELSGGFYVKIGGYLNQILYSSDGMAKIVSEETVTESVKQFSSSVLSSLKSNISLLLGRFMEHSFFYWRSIFQEVYVNLYTLPLVVYGVYIFFKNKDYFSNIQHRRNVILMLSILGIFLLFFARTAGTGGHGFRIAFILIIPFIFFSYLSINHFLRTWKCRSRDLIFALFTFVYILIYFFFVQERHFSNEVIASSFLIEFFIRYKVLFDSTLYSLPLIVIIFSLDKRTKKIFLLVWVLFVSSYKITPQLLNSYLIDKKSSIEYNLTYAKDDLFAIKEAKGKVLTNYERAFYYYSGFKEMPNNERKNLPIIRPKPGEIYEKRVFSFDEKDIDSIKEDFLCDKEIDYIFYINKSLTTNLLNKNFDNIDEVNVRKAFYEKDILNWTIYEFDKESCR